jgi:hypothetical protein
MDTNNSSSSLKPMTEEDIELINNSNKDDDNYNSCNDDNYNSCNEDDTNESEKDDEKYNTCDEEDESEKDVNSNSEESSERDVNSNSEESHENANDNSHENANSEESHNDDEIANGPEAQILQFRALFDGIISQLNPQQNQIIENAAEYLNVGISFNINSENGNLISNVLQNVFLNVFPLSKYKISFNIDSHNIYTALQHVIDYTLYQKPSKEIYYEILDKNEHLGTGDGANRNVYMHLNSTMEEHKIVKRVNQYFVDLNYENYLFENEININALAKFIYSSIKYDCKLPFHLHPRLLETIVEYNRGYSMDDDEILYFMKTLQPDIYRTSIVLSQDEFKELDCGFNTHIEYYKSLIYGSDDMETSIKKNIINGTIATFYLDNQMFSDILSVIELDKLISGNYIITHEIVLEKMSVEPEHYTEEWETFIKTLTYDELKNMLILITNSVSLDEPIKVCICEMNSISDNNIEEDIRISTCFRKVSINENIFKNKMTENLKQYFISKDIQCIDDF